MKHQVFEDKVSGFHWIDMVAPTQSELRAITKSYGLPSLVVKDCLDPEHLPKFERLGKIYFIILRAYDRQCPLDADSMQELTRKLAIFVGEKFILTVHRKDLQSVEEIRKKWSAIPAETEQARTLVLADLLQGVLASYENPIDREYNHLEECEMRIFGHQKEPFVIEEGYYLKRRASVFKRVLKLSADILPKISNVDPATQTPTSGGPTTTSSLFQDIKELQEGLSFQADILHEGITSLLNLHISLSSQKTNEASHRTNEVVRTLTVFSVFFLPLNFIASIYGMNFEHMPELRWAAGYPVTLSIMATVAIGLFLWIRHRGWLK